MKRERMTHLVRPRISTQNTGASSKTTVANLDFCRVILVGRVLFVLFCFAVFDVLISSLLFRFASLRCASSVLPGLCYHHSAGERGRERGELHYSCEGDHDHCNAKTRHVIRWDQPTT